jgi:hypothetical protein
VGRRRKLPIHRFMKVRRTLALLGPLAAAGALLLPWYHDSSGAVRGWDLLTGMNWLLLVIVLGVAVPVLLARAATARRAAVCGGFVLAALALRCLFVPWEHAGLGEAGRSVGAWVVLAAGLGTIAAGRALHAGEDDVDTLRRLLALLGPLAAVSALCLPWFAYSDLAGPAVETGWSEFTSFDALLVAFGAIAAAASVAARRDLARGATVLSGIALAVLAIISLIDRPELDSLVLTGPIVTLAAGAVTALAGFHLYAPRRCASSLITAS